MSKFNSIIFGALAMLSVSCTLDLHPLNGPSSQSFPASESEANAGILAAYKGMGLMSAQNNYFPYALQDCATDVFSYRTGASNIQKQLTSSLTSDHALVEKEFPYVFKVAGRCHQILDKLDNLKGNTSPEIIGRFKAEALCIRAQQYDQCMQFYGGIPFIDHCLDLKDNAYPRDSVVVCVDRLLKADLTDENLSYLPVRWAESNGTTRIGRAAAYTLKARIALNWGYLDIAVDAAKKAMDLSSEAGYGLMELNLPDECYIPHDKGELDVTALFGFQGQTCKEMMWAIQRDKIVGELQQGIYYASPRVHGGCSWYGPTLSQMDAYQMKNGKRITDADSGYDPKNPYVGRDPRMAITACLPGTRVMGIEFEMKCSDAKVVNYNEKDSRGQYALIQNMDGDPAANKVEYAACGTKGPGGYLCRKFSDPAYYGIIANKEDELNTILIRYAELLLIEAEANIEYDKGDLNVARNNINALRARYGMPAVTDNSREGLRSALRYERRVELAGEGFRWFDLRRWTTDGLVYENGRERGNLKTDDILAAKVCNGPQWAPGIPSSSAPENYISGAKPTIDENWLVSYKNTDVWPSMTFNIRGENTKFDSDMVFNYPKDLRWPMPFTELHSNPKMDPVTDQNPGY